MPYERNFMSTEIKSNSEKIFNSREEITDFVMKNIPGYTETKLNEPTDGEQSTLSQFLERANNGSEWTDPHGFKINIFANIRETVFRNWL
jgi:antibiotic biosynthesis monooxygenase (ABM) superfamily enzyme